MMVCLFACHYFEFYSYSFSLSQTQKVDLIVLLGTQSCLSMGSKFPEISVFCLDLHSYFSTIASAIVVFNLSMDTYIYKISSVALCIHF